MNEEVGGRERKGRMRGKKKTREREIEKGEVKE